ncbi:hypothetical protein A3C20_03740 [Candidatus Kaiserbacteria bacterium RIFCSPHIGHO2_02_FULL_55_25]|uniref:Uncharacterized protein n=1 Tax=Candidatus Kaiserbacteria bacterium RIFCSPHIGHO2_02_FULL_55_25 TaxID=1798498 RepID=A0A1F6E7I2_9BACT|nr:MAG: hypothetical protein A2764_04005 [Candidatus Kaiserbacteria bacterium RIFCSPHIGHO2_01_FULL_55_79]OGG69606.1 MAG: hypothetical protein A3C20_03740 [Candidatus Kaiserbacteria bacterium RIFCSPHIGHO2_02_FULL_55_25]OGG76971.1 MAG: hypothetical protein A3F56_02475 [Candidatus Kaiserbacteria bacterium RIFCSPHIGHO2_12_FULL_55_13]OGG83265.1 MAG: hypothetical protein A3A42_01655 [Candidatus Kaiserbacteria bacterium RIFCSPLOWO2_01_FULL_55_25]
MEWAHEHPYLSALIAAGAFLVFGVLVVGYRAAQPQGGSLQVWGGGPNALLNPTSYEPGATVGIQTDIIGGGNAPVFSVLRPQQQIEAQNEAGGGFDISLFIAGLSQPSTDTATTPVSSQPDLSLAYSFIPSGLVATTTPGPKRGVLQESLYQYGNDVGSYISTYESASVNTGQVLTDQVHDRRNAQKAQAVRNIGTALQTAGKNLQGIEAVPSIVSSAHVALAESYIEAGISLSKVPDAQSDGDFIAAIQDYNTAAEQLGRNYVALANVFAGTGVRFSPQDPGSVFIFSGGSGL